jgi:hypothetical protein
MEPRNQARIQVDLPHGKSTTADELMDFMAAGLSAPWRLKAACLDAPGDTMFPTRGQGPSFRAAIAYCNRCPVIKDCKTAGRNEMYGVWGGEFKGRTQGSVGENAPSRDRVLEILRSVGEPITANRVADITGTTLGAARRHLAALRDRNEAVFTKPKVHTAPGLWAPVGKETA